MVEKTVGKTVGNGLVRLLLVAAIVIGILLVVVGLTQANVTGLVLGVLLVAGAGYFLVRNRT